MHDLTHYSTPELRKLQAELVYQGIANGIFEHCRLVAQVLGKKYEMRFYHEPMRTWVAPHPTVIDRFVKLYWRLKTTGWNTIQKCWNGSDLVYVFIGKEDQTAATGSTISGDLVLMSERPCLISPYPFNITAHKEHTTGNWLYVPGAWETVIPPAYQKTLDILDRKAITNDELERQQLIKTLQSGKPY